MYLLYHHLLCYTFVTRLPCILLYMICRCFLTKQYYSLSDPAYLAWVRGGDRHLMTEAIVVRRGATFRIGGPANASLSITGHAADKLHLGLWRCDRTGHHDGAQCGTHVWPDGNLYGLADGNEWL